MYHQRYIAVSFNKCTLSKSLWIQASAKELRIKVLVSYLLNSLNVNVNVVAQARSPQHTDTQRHICLCLINNFIVFFTYPGLFVGVLVVSADVPRVPAGLRASVKTCRYNGSVYQPGETFTKQDLFPSRQNNQCVMCTCSVRRHLLRSLTSDDGRGFYKYTYK